MATSRGGYAAPVKPKKPTTDAQWLKAHPNWTANRKALWAKNNPPPLFPSTNVSQGELSGLLKNARTQVTQSYNATPLPSLQTYLQPFADAQARNQGYAANYDTYLQNASNQAQNISGAFNTALTGGVNAGAASVQGQGGSGQPGAIPTAQQALIPVASIGNSYTNYFNAERPYVQAATNETSRALNQQQASALQDYRDAQAQRRQEVQDAIQKLYQTNLDTLQTSKANAEKAAVTEYLALGKTAYENSLVGAKNKDRRSREQIAADKLKLGRDTLNATKSYHQASLDAKRTAASAKGIDLSPIYKTLFVTTPGKSGSGERLGNYYTVEKTNYAPDGTTVIGTDKKQIFVPVGRTPAQILGRATLPKGTTATLGAPKFAPGTGSTGSTRKATAASWQRAWTQLVAQYGARYDQKYLKSLMPARPPA